MFEDFRKQAEEANLFDDDQNEKLREEISHYQDGYFLGMTPIQRFILAFMLFMMITILGILFLVVTSKIVLPFMG
jgi:hypothetical protein